MNSVIEDEIDGNEFVEVDPTGRYGRYNEILGKGASKTVYKAFDEYNGIEVAWNQVKLYDFLQRPEDLETLYCEIHLLKTLNHNNIMKLYASWVDTTHRNINFVTEMFTSGTLRQYRLKHKRVNIRAMKHWCRQILEGLLYLHSRDPPVIHRDLKCDNIFINGNHGEVKIGDLGLAAILRKSHAARCVGTPEFMAPEIYAEEYNELVDIYSFGMCILEMVTFDYPYSECTHPAQIYKKVVSGKKPEALYKVKDTEIKQFVEKCLASVSIRLSAKDLLEDPFLQIDNNGFDLRPLDYYQGNDDVALTRQPLLDYYGYDYNNHSVEFDSNEINSFDNQVDEHSKSVDISINGSSNVDGIFLRLRIGDKEGRVRNIYFNFDIETDTGLSVAAEMIDELDISDQFVTKITQMIDNEITSLVPEWKKSLNPISKKATFCQNCAQNTLSKSLQVLECCENGCASIHGRFEEITYIKNDENCENYELEEGEKMIDTVRVSIDDDYENEIRKELRWLKAKYQMQLREFRNKQIGGGAKKSKKSCEKVFPESGEIFLFQKALENCENNENERKLNFGSGSGKSFYSGLDRATSLPVDAVDV